MARALSAALAGFFLYSASFKLLSAAPLRATLHALRLPLPIATQLARAVPVFEILLALALLGFVPSLTAVILLISAALAIATAGIAGLLAAEPIPCSCLSAYSTHNLGYRQIVTTVGLLAAAGVILTSTSDYRDMQEPLVRLVIVSCSGVLVHLLTSRDELRRLFEYRRSAAGTYPA